MRRRPRGRLPEGADSWQAGTGLPVPPPRERQLMNITANGISIEVEDQGPHDAPAVLLIMGLGMQLIAWPPYFVQPLLDAGYRVIRFDNRDVGLSQYFDELGPPNLPGALARLPLGLPVKPPYTVHDMALDALGVRKAHVVGVSMGGMIAQRVALAAPQRLLSLTSIMSSSGAAGLPQAAPEVLGALVTPPPADLEPMRERIVLGLQRAFHPVGTSRQLLAVLCDSGRAEELRAIRTPTLVLHGKQDPLVPYACGEDTQRRIRGAQLVGIEGMGHDLPPGAAALLLEALLPHLKANR